ncbi:MAG TPA: hypothetical protein VFW96_10560 [Thermomicrobiales bacterium]|nr:hypothetical protein [Thermomicrobiales bacterium]
MQRLQQTIVLRRLAPLVLMLVAAMWPLGAARAASMLTLTPNPLSCESASPSVEAHGAGLRPGPVVLILAVVGSAKGVVVGRTAAAADGTFATTLQLRGAIACGNRYTVDVVAADASGRFGPPVLASATLKVVGTSMPGLPNTGAGGAWTQTSPGGLLAAGAFLAAVAGIGFGYGGVRRRRGRRPAAGAREGS